MDLNTHNFLYKSFKVFLHFKVFEHHCLHVLLPTLKAKSTTGSFYLCCLLHVLSMIIKSGLTMETPAVFKLILLNIKHSNFHIE